MEDPIRAEVPQAIKECENAGIKVIMITGDFPATARSIGNQIGLDPLGKLMSGDELRNINDEELRKLIINVTIFARVVPDQKLRIVQALKANNEVVAMTGDGVNDAPALKASHIGIAMGNKGTDVAREASSLVLLYDNFASIVAAIRSGRRIFDNLQKAMSYITAIHIPIIGLTTIPAFFSSIPLLLMPLHIVFMELIIDPSCSIAFEFEKEEKNIMSRKPRSINEVFFGTRKLFLSSLQGFLLLGMTIVIYFISVKDGHSEGEVRAIAFSALIIGNLMLILSNLSKTRGILNVLSEKNIALYVVLASTIIMLGIIISVPFFREIFSFDFPGFSLFLPAFVGSVIVLILIEIPKYYNNRRSVLN